MSVVRGESRIFQDVTITVNFTSIIYMKFNDKSFLYLKKKLAVITFFLISYQVNCRLKEVVGRP